MNDDITVLLSGDESALHSRVRDLSGRITIVTPGQVEERPELLQNVQAAYGWLGAAQIAEAKNLRWLQTAGAGVNGLLTPALRERDLVITNASGIHAEPITEHMFGMLLMHTRRLAEAWERQKTHHWGGYDYGANVGMLAGRTLGVLGVGAIGGHSARVGKAFGMRVLGLRRSGDPHPDVVRMYAPGELPAFLAECDVVMNSLPLTDKTRGLLGAPEFEALKAGAIIINTGRGATMDTGALMAALQSGHLGAALLDVTDPEPLPADHPLWAMDNVSITPHYSGSHPGYGSRADEIFLWTTCAASSPTNRCAMLWIRTKDTELMHASFRLLPLSLLGLLIAPLHGHADPAANLLPPITDVKIGPRDWTPGAPPRMAPPDPTQDPTDPGVDPAAPAAPPKPVTHGWVLFLTGTAQATPTPVEQVLKIDTSASDGTDWHVRLAYDPNVVNGQLYELRFRAKSDVARSVAVASEVGSNNVWPGLYRRVNLTTDWQTFARRFVAQKAEDGKNILPEFWIGDKSGSLWLSDVTLTPLPVGSSLLPPVTDAAAWEFAEQRPDARMQMGMPPVGGAAPTPATAAPAPLTKVTTEGDAMKFELDSRPAGYSAVWQGRAALNEGTAYTLTFRAKADPPRDLPLQADVEAPGVAPEGLEDKVKVKRDWQTFSVTWTTKAGTKENHIAPQFVVGGNLGTLWLSDVSLTEGAAPVPVADATPALPAVAAAPKPSAGEIALSGKITAVRAAAHSLTLAATAVTSTDGKTTALPAPRPKTVLVGPSLPFADLKPGVSVTVIGKDAGAGKPLTARAIVVGP